MTLQLIFHSYNVSINLLYLYIPQQNASVKYEGGVYESGWC